MQSFERQENLFRILGVEALTVIADEHSPFPLLLLGANLQTGRLVGTEFDGVTDQILKHQRQLVAIRP